MERVNIHQTKTHLSRLLEQVEAGEEIIIAKAGKPVAKLVPYRTEANPREPGYWRGRFRSGRILTSCLPASPLLFEAKHPEPAARHPCAPLVASGRCGD